MPAALPTPTPLAAPRIDLPADARARLHALAAAALADGRRRLLGLAGPPGVGKSTVAAALVACLADAFPPGFAQAVPMDGFHLANSELLRLGRRGRKGAPDTFDAGGYAALLARLRAAGADECVWAPDFRREIEEPVAGAIAIPASARLVITEGNYLLLDQGDWARVAPQLDACWYLVVDDGLREQRLVARHQQFGRSAEAARDWVAGTDAPNARLTAGTRVRAHFELHLPAA